MKKLANYPFQKFLFEEDLSATVTPPLQTLQPIQPGNTLQPQNISLDQKVDNFIIQYERESQPNQMPEAKTRNSFRGFLFETDDDPPKDNEESTDSSGGLGGDDPLGLGTAGDGGADDPFADPSAGEDGDGDKSSSEDQTVMAPVPRINVKVMAPMVARLVSNYESLLDPRTVILNRVQAYMQKNYNESVANELMQTLELNFNLKARQTTVGQDSYPGMNAGVGDLSDNTSSGGSGVSSGS